MEIKFKLLTKTSKLPTRVNKRSAGMDFYSNVNLIIPPKTIGIIPLGVAYEIIYLSAGLPYIQLKGRSGLAFNHNIEITNAGVLDDDYRGEIKAKLINLSNSSFLVRKGDKICQGVVHILPEYKITETNFINNTERNVNGFGSTGR